MSLGYITKKEFLKEFRIDRHTMDKWISERGLPIRKIGYKTYIQKEELNQWMNEFSVNEPSLLDLKSIFS